MAGPAATGENQRERLFIVMIDQHQLRLDARFAHQSQRPFRTAFLIPVRCMNQDRQIKLLREFNLGREIFGFGLGLVIKTNLADRHDAVFLQITR